MTGSFFIILFLFNKSYLLHRYPKPRPEITERILARALKLCPDLAPPEIRAQREPTVDDLRPLIVPASHRIRSLRLSRSTNDHEGPNHPPIDKMFTDLPALQYFYSSLPEIYTNMMNELIAKSQNIRTLQSHHLSTATMRLPLLKNLKKVSEICS